MTVDTVRKAIRSDVAMVSSVILFVAGVLWPVYSIKTDIALLNQNVSAITSNITDIKLKDNQQDTDITDNSVNVANIRGSLNQRGFQISQVNVRQADTTNSVD